MEAREAAVTAGAQAAPPAAELAPPSPCFSIPAVKLASRRPTIDLQAWAALPGSPSAFGSGGAGAPNSTATSVNSEATEVQARQPVWTRVWSW